MSKIAYFNNNIIEEITIYLIAYLNTGLELSFASEC